MLGVDLVLNVAAVVVGVKMIDSLTVTTDKKLGLSKT
jgi:hypothetical protein